MDAAEAGDLHLQNLKYLELVEQVNKDIKQQEYMDRPLQLYKDEKAQMAQIIKEQDEKLNEVKKYVYPFWTIAFIVNSLLLIGFYRQEKQIKKN